MLSLLIFASFCLTNSPYSFEVQKGWVLEPVVGGALIDSKDPSAWAGGLRISGLSPTQTDAVITLEVEVLPQFILTGSGDTPRAKYLFNASLVFYEIYNPYALRVAIGGGGEKRGSEISPQGLIRGGLGRYFTSNFAVYVDIASRTILREAKASFPLELTSSLQFIF